jgi:hypothetical protein
MHAIYCFVLFVSLAVCQQSNNPPFKIAVSAENLTVVAGTEISINVSLTNTSDHNVDEGAGYGRGNLDSTFRFEVRDEHGKMVPKRAYPHPELGVPGSVKFRTISPRETIIQEQQVSALYDMRKPGKYTIQVWRRDPKYDIKSNIVTVTVTPKNKVPMNKPGKAGHV